MIASQPLRHKEMVAEDFWESSFLALRETNERPELTY